MANLDRDKDTSLLNLYEMCKIVGDQLTSRDVRVLKLMFNGIFTQEFLAQIHDGFSFLQALEKIDKVDDSNFRNVENYLRMINRHDLLQFLSLRRRKTVRPDPVTQYLEECATASRALVPDDKLEAVVDGTVRLTTDPPSTGDSEPMPSSSCAKRQQDTSEGSTPGSSKKLCTPSKPGESATSSLEGGCSRVLPCSPKSRRRSGKRSSETAPRRRSERLKRKSEEHESCGSGTIAISATENRSQTCVDSMVNGSEEQQMKKKVTCDIRLRVRAEYANHQTALQGNIHSNKPEQIERQFEKFMQANTILKSRDLGSIICDIKFSELTYLDAFWRDYINGSLLEALKGVFITESLKQAVGHEAIKLLVNVDEDDYEAGRLMLLQSLKESQ